MANEPRVALVTGAGSGIGRAVAAGMLVRGYAVVLAGRTRDTLEETVRSSGAPSARAVCIPADVTSDASVAALFDEVRTRFGRLDVLFNNAGVSAPLASIDELTAEQWRAVVDVNLTGAFLCTRHAFALMKAQHPRGGRIINNGSLAAHVPRPRSAPYAATKHALTGLTKATALDGRAFDIACGQIDIGNAATAMAAAHQAGALQPNGEIASEPLLDLAHVVDAVLYMAGLPLDANVPFLTVMATRMPFLGRG
jgi:NAD(P)-dependent dehydrogenase (short-subunit alcohol dehydrogenase family)